MRSEVIEAEGGGHPSEAVAVEYDHPSDAAIADAYNRLKEKGPWGARLIDWSEEARRLIELGLAKIEGNLMVPVLEPQPTEQ